MLLLAAVAAASLLLAGGRAAAQAEPRATAEGTVTISFAGANHAHGTATDHVSGALLTDAERQRYAPIATNLVHNAIVHNLPEAGSVWVTTCARANRAVLTIENTGQKLAPDVVATLLEPFQRGTKRIRTDHAGVGLGLAVVKSIARAHDGTVTLAQRSEGGLHATVELPASTDHRPLLMQREKGDRAFGYRNSKLRTPR